MPTRMREYIEGLGRAPEFKVRVDQLVIDRTMVANSFHCAIAEAVKEALPDARFVAVDTQSIRYSLPNRGIRCHHLTPRKVQEFIIDQDHAGILLERARIEHNLGHHEEADKLTAEAKKFAAELKPFGFWMRQGFVTKSGMNDDGAPAKKRRRRRQRAKAILVSGGKKSQGSGAPMPYGVGGRMPPRAMTGRRNFGLRALKYG